MQKFSGSEEFIEKAREVVLDEFNRKPQGLDYAIKRIRRRFTNSNGNNASSRERGESAKDTGRSIRNAQQQKNNESKSIKNDNRTIRIDFITTDSKYRTLTNQNISQ